MNGKYGLVNKYGLVQGSVLKYVVLACMAAYYVLPSSGHATIFGPSVDAGAQVYFSQTSDNSSLSPSACDNFSPIGATTSCNGNANTPDYMTTNAVLNYQTTATAGYGVLKAAATSSVTGPNTTLDQTYYSTADAKASFYDIWTIYGGTGTGKLNIQVALDGTYNYCDINSGVGIGVSLYNFTNSQSSGAAPTGIGINCTASPSENVTLSTNFTFGTPTNFVVTLEASSELYDLGGTSITSSASFADTASVNAITVDDSQGNQIPFTLSTGSGASLFSTLAPSPTVNSVPEPATLSIFGFGLAGLGFMLRRRKRT